MSQALIISEFHFLEFEEIRMNAIRIPEVLFRIREAQELWCRFNVSDLDLQNYLVSGDDQFFANEKLKSLISRIVLKGFYDRLKKSEGVVGEYFYDEQLTSFVDCIDDEVLYRGHIADLMFEIKKQGPLSPCQRARVPHFVYGQTIDGKLNPSSEKIALPDLVEWTHDQKGYRQFLLLGPSLLKEHLKMTFSMREFSFVDSVEIDPMLSWFWGKIAVISQEAAVC
ncbi:MAG: hypothetical protein KDD50_08035 [Bdellovibrionales bacterium]|nr:hypothetical protein [Bdellovibrionales bacterium]